MAHNANSPSSVDSSATTENYGGTSQQDLELQRKRARDRKSQQAMRDRTKWTVHNLTAQVTCFSEVLEEKGRDVGILRSRLAILEAENAHLRAQNAALQLSLLGRNSPQVGAGESLSHLIWERPPRNSPPSCIADQILQGFVDSARAGGSLLDRAHATYSQKPNLRSLLETDQRTDDDISNVVADVLRTYTEIETLPQQVAVFYLMATLLKWMVLLDQHSWMRIPPWLRPVPCQLTKSHSAWIDRIPWPRAREYLIKHPEITLDDFAAPYSSSFHVSWQYDPSHVLVATTIAESGSIDVTINPVYEEHLRQLRHWVVGDPFRKRFPELSALIDKDSTES